MEMVLLIPEGMRKFWNKWEIRLLVLASLTLQSFLVLLGNRRRYTTSIIVRFLLWVAYTASDWLVAVTLGVLSNKVGDSDSGQNYHLIIALWAPFLLLHLGSPDTVTAYSIEDNELWLRRLISFCAQLGVAMYILFRVWTSDVLNIFQLLIFISGLIKLGERAWVHWSASSQIFKESLFPEPDPGPNFARFLEFYGAKKEEGFAASLGDLIESPSVGDHTNLNIVRISHTKFSIQEEVNREEGDIYRADILYHADKFFKTFKPLLADLILSFDDVVDSRAFVQSRCFKQVFEVIEVELGFVFDVFYTKSIVVHSYVGFVLRSICFFFTSVVLCFFCFAHKVEFPETEVVITYVLLGGTIVFEACSVIILVVSDRTILWLYMDPNKFKGWIRRSVLWIHGLQYKLGKKINASVRFVLIPLVAPNNRWSNKMAQFNLIRFCLKGKPETCSWLIYMINRARGCTVDRHGKNEAKNKLSVTRFLRKIIRHIYDTIEKHCYTRLKPVNDDLKRLILVQFLKKIEDAKLKMKNNNAGTIAGARVDLKDELSVAEEIKKFCLHRGANVLEEEKCLDELGWSVNVEFDQSILLWHIATDVCFYADPATSDCENLKDASKLMSDYMVYLLVLCPYMLPNGIGQIRFQDTYAEASEFFTKMSKTPKLDEARVCEELKEVGTKVHETEVHPSRVKGDRSKSVLFDASRLAKSLQDLEGKEPMGKKKKWELITKVWVEMLGYAASHCQWNHHIQQLRQGGELLTHVCLLMAHLGITQQFQISQGHARAKLIVK